MFASKCVSGRTDASVLVLGRWSWGIIDLIQVMFLLSPYAQSLEQDGFGTVVLEIPSKHTGDWGAGSDGGAPGGSQGSRFLVWGC